MRGGYESLEEEGRLGNGFPSASYAQPIRPDLFAVPSRELGPPGVHVHNAAGKRRWEHQPNLDQFFRRIYEYHQKGGFLCILLLGLLNLVQFLFVAAFATFLVQCVRYDVLFNKNSSATAAGLAPFNRTTTKRTLRMAVNAQCMSQAPVWLWGLLVAAAVVFAWKAVRSCYQLVQAWEIRSFYHAALRIPDADLDNLTWHDVLQKLCEVQVEQRLCVNSVELSELVVYQRILRHTNYLVALVNKGLLPPRLSLPCSGGRKLVYLPSGLKWNLELLLFWNSWGPWEDYFALKPSYKHPERLGEATRQLQQATLWLGLLNLVLSPVILVWQVVYSAFSWSEQIKREPSALGMRTWSVFGRLYFRHLNELEHELEQRLNRAYRPAAQYQDLFVSRLGELVGRNVALVAGAVFAAIFALGAWDEDVYQVEHMLTIMTVAGGVVLGCKLVIQDENVVWAPEYLLQAVLANVHYLPDSWKGQAHTDHVRHEFGQLFQFKLAFLLEELLSPLLTPFVLLFHVFPQVPSIVTFFHRFTVEVAGLGDVCSFSQMELGMHGDAQWQTDEGAKGPPAATADPTARAAHGKTEMSLLHFSLANPAWVPPAPESRFLERLRATAERDAAALVQPAAQRALDNPLLHSLSALGALPHASLLPHASVAPSGVHFSRLGTLNPSMRHLGPPAPVLKGRGVRRTEGPNAASMVGGGEAGGVMSSLRASGLLGSSVGEAGPLGGWAGGAWRQPEGPVAEMSLHALYLHELHHRKRLRGEIGDGGYGAISPETEEEGGEAEETEEPSPSAPPNLWNVPEDTER